MISQQIQDLLNSKVKEYNRLDFIENDPISIPHQFRKKQDIEIMGFWAAMLAWGQRKTIINKCNQLVMMMDNAPHDFICNHQEKDLVRFSDFKHRTFNNTDTLYFLAFFKDFYSKNDSLETAFSQHLKPSDENVGNAIIGFEKTFFASDDFPQRTKKHIATPLKKSACKRINMFLRWMVRKDLQAVDFGIWENIETSQLICPLDIHVSRVSKKLGLLHRKQSDWKAAVHLTEQLKTLDKQDPVKYDFALFGLGLSGY